jgi:hypothetical protein
MKGALSTNRSIGSLLHVSGFDLGCHGIEITRHRRMVPNLQAVDR